MSKPQIIGNEKEMKELFRKNYPKIFPGYAEYKKEGMIRYKKKYGFIDIILKHKRKRKYLLIEFKFNNTDKRAINQINKYYLFFLKNLSLTCEKAKKYIIDFNISKEIKGLCKKNKISCLCLREIPIFKNYEFKKIKSDNALSKTNLTFSINKNIAKDFKKLCETEGWKLGKQIEKAMSDVIKSRKLGRRK
jgi:predicted transport protein